MKYVISENKPRKGRENEAFRKFKEISAKDLKEVCLEYLKDQ